jgi:predicted permease
VSELALALTLVLSAGLLLRSFARLAAFSPGFELEHLLTFQVYPPMARYETRDQLVSFYRRARERLEAVPGVVSVGTASAGPLIGGGDGRTPFLVRGRSEVPLQEAPTVQWFDAGPGYFPTLGVPILQGRNLSESDGIGSTVTALINQTMASQHWPGASPIGARLSLPQWDAEVEIVGVVADLRSFDAPRAVEPSVFVSNRQRPRWATFFVVRTTGRPSAIAPGVRSAFAELDPEVEPLGLSTMEQLLGASLVGPRFNLLLIALFAVIALILSSVGIYAVISYTVALRTREFGIRMALGARRAQVLRAVLLDGVRMIAAGLLLGGTGAFFFTRLLRGAIPDVAPSDPMAVFGTVLVLALSGALATLAPALRASRTEPVDVLRAD